MPDTTATAKRPEPKLESLPVELIKNVAACLSHADLRNLRRTSRECNNKVIETYTVAHFTEQAFFLGSQENLETAVLVASHPILGKAVKKLLLYLDLLPPEDCLPVDNNGNFSAAAWQFLACSWLDYELLRAAFFLFKQHGQLQEIELVNIGMGRRRPCSTPGFSSEKSEDLMRPGVQNATPLNLVISALEESELRIKSLIADADEWCLPVTDLYLPDTCHALEKLHSHFWIPWEMQEDASTLFRDIARLPDLKYLRLRQDTAKLTRVWMASSMTT